MKRIYILLILGLLLAASFGMRIAQDEEGDDTGEGNEEGDDTGTITTTDDSADAPPSFE